MKSRLELPSRPNDLSIVIIGKNAEWSIARLLDSVLACSPPGVTSEVIYVDSASIDRTIEIVSHYPVKIIRLAASRALCASAGRFVGSRHATGEYIAFFDSDMEVMDGWLAEAMRVLERHSEIAVVSGIQVDIKSAAPPETLNCTASAVRRITEIKFAGSAAMFRREALNVAGTWNPHIISDEEPELCLRIRRAGYRIVQLPRPSVRHYGYAPATLSSLIARRKRRLFLGYGQVLRLHLGSGLLIAYLRERGWVMLPALAGLAALAAVLASLLSGNIFWVVGFVCFMLLAFVGDVLRSRSVYRAVFHVVHRALILEGTIRGFIMRPHAPDEHPCAECSTVYSDSVVSDTAKAEAMAREWA